jgi:hypothetical protein
MCVGISRKSRCSHCRASSLNGCVRASDATSLLSLSPIAALHSLPRQRASSRPVVHR